MRTLTHATLGLLLLSTPVCQGVETDEIDYRQQVQPILQKYCASCHNDDDREGDFSAESYTGLQQGGASGPAFIPEQGKDSRLVRMLTGALEPRMPPEENEPPTAAEIAVLTAWIDAGARGPAGEEPSRRHLVTPKIQPIAEVGLPITAAARSIDNRIAVASFERVEVRDATGEQILFSLDGFPGKVNAVHFSADGRQLVTASGITGLYGEATIWNSATGERIRSFTGHRDTLYDAELSPDGKLLATCGYDREVALWDVASGEVARTLAGHNDAIYDLAFSPDGAVLATASGDETVKVWETRSGQRLDTLSQPEGEQYAVCFAPNGRFIVAGGADNRIRVWRFVSKGKQRINPLVYSRFAHEGAITNLEFSPDGRQLISGAEDRTLKLWDSRQFTQTHLFELQPDQVTALVPDRDGQQLLVTRMDGSTSLYPLTGHGARAAEATEAATDDEPMEPAGSINELVEHEPNDRLDDALTVLLPARIRGVIQGADGATDDDLFRFRSAAGEQWMIEVSAARQKSPLDSLLEVLDDRGRPVERVLLRAVRDSYFTFRGKDSTTSDDFRLHNWEEMELNEYLYCEGEVVKLWHYPRGPDSGFQVYPGRGSRNTYFDTTALAHALHTPCYIVEPYPPGTSLIPNGLPTFNIYYENDDDALREWGMDSRLLFRAPADGDYVVRLTDSRGFSGDDYRYELTIRPRQPDFKVTVGGTNPQVEPGSGREFSLTVQRLDGFDGEVHVDIRGLPPGFRATSPVIIEAGQQTALGTLYAAPDAPVPTPENANGSQLTARAKIHNREVVRDLGSLGEIKLGAAPKLLIRVVDKDADVTLSEISFDEPYHLSVAPGETIEAKVLIDRRDFQGNVSFGKADAGRNLPHGVYVDNIGLNGLLITAEQSERTFFITAAKWLPETVRVFHLRAETGGNPTSWPVVLHVRPTD